MFSDRLIHHIAAGAISVSGFASPARAEFPHEFAELLYSGQTVAAVQLAEDEGAHPTARMAEGSARFLLAIEHLGQGLHDHGLRSEYVLDGTAAGMNAMPILRLPVPDNPNPEPMTYAAMQGLLDRFQTDLETAATALARVGEQEIKLTLDLERIRLDFDGDGIGGERESLLLPFAAVNARAQTTGSYVVDFDQSDAPWLQGYCNLLQAMVKFPLAHDWRPAFDTTLHSLFPKTELPSSELHREMQRAQVALQALVDRLGGPPRAPDFPDYARDLSQEESSRIMQEYFNSPEMRAYQDYMGLRDLGFMASIADLLAFVHLFNWPLTDAETMGEVRLHLLEMVRLSRVNWQRILAETDNGREWVPSPDQTGIFPNLIVDQDRVNGWSLFLDEFEAVLNGARLVPHWRFVNRGINIRRMFEEPRSFDPVLIAQGVAVLPYLEDGDEIGEETVMTLVDIFGGGFLAYFLWLN